MRKGEAIGWLDGAPAFIADERPPPSAVEAAGRGRMKCTAVSNPRPMDNLTHCQGPLAAKSFPLRALSGGFRLNLAR